MDAVERVEIVQGPLSALYGANAFIATVNVITRDPADAPDVALAGRGTVINGNAGGGGSVLVTDHGENVGLLGAFSLDWQDRSGLNIDQTFPNQDPNADRFRHLFRERSQGDIAAPMSMYLRLDVGDPEHKIGKLTLQGGIQRLDSVGEFQVNAAMSHRSRYSIINYWSNASLVKRFSDEVSAELNLGYSEGTPTRDYRLFVAQDDDAFYRPRFGYRAINGGLNVHYSPLGEQLSFRIGADAEADFEDVLFYEKTFLVPFGERDPGDSLDLIGQDADRTQLVWDVGLSLQIKSVPLPETLPALRLTGNARVDFIEYGDIDFPTQFSWRAGIVYEWMDELVTKVVGGRAFQTPSPVLMFAKPGYGRANNVIGNADVRDLGFDQLEPQTVTGVEAIVSAELFDAVSLDVSGYFQQIEDRILFSQLATDFIASNEESVQNVGGLASMKVDVDRVSGYATATVQRQIVDGTIVDQPPARFPNYFGTFGLNVDVPEAHLLFNAHLRWAGERGATQSNELINNAFYELDGYATVDLSVTTDELYLWNDDSETKLSFSVRNVADTQFSEPGFAGFDIPNLGRTFWFEARQRF
jgi:iron complex outermembrane receptor protein